MKIHFLVFILTLTAAVLLGGCSKRGCTDPLANNYDTSAQLDDKSCEYKRGCTNCLAINFDSTAVSEDGSCNYSTFEFAGTYEMIDSLILPSQDIIRDTYNLTVSRDSCGAYSLVLSNYANLAYSDGSRIKVSALFNNDSLIVPSQTVSGETGLAADVLTLSATTGYFKGDSLVLPLYFSDANQSYYGGSEGKQ